MSSHLVALAAAGALCAGCAAPAFQTTLSLDDPANPAAASVPFVRPVNVLAAGALPAIAAPSSAVPIARGSMQGMPMPGAPMSGTMPGMDHGPMPGMVMPGQSQ